MARPQLLHPDLEHAFKVFKKCDFEIQDLQIGTESTEYGACTFRVNGYNAVFRVSKITPTKKGQFVTIWKRGVNGETEPFDRSDTLDFIIVSSRSGHQFGQFIFPKSVLVEKGIISAGSSGGKRGIRVYPPWDTDLNKQASKTQAWQIAFFTVLTELSDFNELKKLMSYTYENIEK